MTSPVEDFSIPDFGSAEQNEDTSEDCRLKKVPSNDIDMLEDSSAVEYVGATCGLKNNEKQSTASASKNSMAGTGNIATGKSLVPLNQSSIIYDEETLMKMTDEELKFFENYKQENHAQMSSLKCTICSCQLFLVNRDNIRIHPVLGVLVCKNCQELYSNGLFTKDENGRDEYCRWCAKDGMIVCCDTCTNVFCVACLGRVNFLEIISSKCKWSCLVCNNRPLWSPRALCRMVMLAMKSTPGMSRRSLQDTNVSSDDSIWLPAIISEAEKLTTYCKALASKYGVNWSIECQEADLRKLVVTTRLNMKLLEEKLVAKFEQNYCNTADTEVDQQESSMAKKDSTQIDDKRPIVKKLSGANSKQDNYAGFQESTPSANSNSTKDSSSESETFVNETGISVIRAFCTDSDSSFNSESEESVFQIDYSYSDSSSSPEIDLNEKAIKRKSSDLDDSLIPSAKRTEIPLEFLGDPKLTNGCFKIEPEENNNDPV